MAKWKELSVRSFAPEALRQMIRALSKANDAIATGLRVTEAQLHLMKLLARRASLNPIEIALRLALQEVLGFMDDLTGLMSAHAILIPIQKPYTGVSLLDEDQKRIDISSWLDQADNLGSYPAAVLRANTPDTIQFISSAQYNRGGNAGYWNEFTRSLGDAGDMARPLFPADHAVTGAAIIVGSSVLGPILGALDVLQMLFRFAYRLDGAYNARPTVRDLRAHIVMLPVSQKLGVQLTWTPVPRILQQKDFSAELYNAKEIVVIRSTDPHLRESFHWHTQFFGFPEEAMDVEGDTRVIAILKNDGFIAGYVDEISMEEGVTYYYALAVHYDVSGFDLMSTFSNVERIYFNGYAMTSRRSEPPDWIATPSLIQLFPLLHEIISRVKMLAAQLTARTTINSGPFQLIAQLLRQIDMLLFDAKLVAMSLERLERILRNISASDFVGLRSTTITVDTGGIYGWARELAARLSDRNDPSRPPYDHGELTAGIIVVAGAPRLPQLTALRKIIALLFGDEGDPARVRALRTLGGPPVIVQGTPLGGARVVRAATRPAVRAPVAFDPQLRPTKAPATPKEKKPAFDDALKPADRDPNC